MTSSSQDRVTETIGIKPWSLYQIIRSPTMRMNIFLIESSEISICPICGYPLKLRDHVKRIMKGSEGEVRWLRIRRLVCINESCLSMHRELPDMLAPYKHFEIDIIAGVLDKLITPDTNGFEDHPSEGTMQQWHRWFRLNRDTMEGTFRSKGYQILGFTEKLLTTSISLLGRLREDTCDWLRIVLRFIYNSGVFLSVTDFMICRNIQLLFLYLEKCAILIHKYKKMAAPIRLLPSEKE